MGANAQTSVTLFVANAILTAQQQNFSAATGVPVFATTVTRDAAFGGSNKVLAEGQLCYLESTDVVQYYTGAAWATVGPTAAPTSGLTLISATTIGTTVASVTVSNAFSATYDTYTIMISGGIASATGVLKTTLGSTSTGYYSKVFYGNYTDNTVSGFGAANAASWANTGTVTANSISYNVTLINPYLAKNTHVYSVNNGSTTVETFDSFGGYLADTTSYTAFTLTTATGTLTGGTIRVYGYANS